MVDSADRSGISYLSMDHLYFADVWAAFMAAGIVGKWHLLGHCPEFVAVGRRHFQALPVAYGIGGYLADAMGSPAAKDCRLRQKRVIEFPADFFAASGGVNVRIRKASLPDPISK
jgi:hypothetical protein